VPTVNIGDRQKGMIKAKIFLDCAFEGRDIVKSSKRDKPAFRKVA